MNVRLLYGHYYYITTIGTIAATAAASVYANANAHSIMDLFSLLDRIKLPTLGLLLQSLLLLLPWQSYGYSKFILCKLASYSFRWPPHRRIYLA